MSNTLHGHTVLPMKRRLELRNLRIVYFRAGIDVCGFLSHVWQTCRDQSMHRPGDSEWLVPGLHEDDTFKPHEAIR